jgi:tRNA pseudouridine55 synthase
VLQVRTTSTDGLLLVDKAAGMTSHDVVVRARRSLRTRRIGHTGTLDPFASGLLVLLIGRATRLARYVDDEPKVYDATVSFGAETTTDDLTGEVTRVAEPPSFEAIDRAMGELTGSILQLPPAYSAKKLGGRRAYAAARSGSPLDLQPANVVVHEWIVRRRDLTSMDVTVGCGKGTYLRALARDLGRASGSAAHLTALRRTNAGAFNVSNAVAVDALDAVESSRFLSLRSAIPDFPIQSVTNEDLRRVLHGNAIAAQTSSARVALVDADGDLVAIAERSGEALQPRLVLRDE